MASPRKRRLLTLKSLRVMHATESPSVGSIGTVVEGGVQGDKGMRQTLDLGSDSSGLRLLVDTAQVLLMWG